MTDPQRPALERALQLAREQVVLLEAALGEGPVPAFTTDDLVPAKVIAKELRRDPETVRGWCRKHGIGIKIGDAWFVSRKSLAAWMASKRTPADLGKPCIFDLPDKHSAGVPSQI